MDGVVGGGWARGWKKARGTRKGVFWSKILCAFCPHPATSPPPQAAGALAFQLSLPAFRCPVARPCNWVAPRFLRRQVQGPWVLSGVQTLQRLVAFLLQMTVVVLLGRERNAVQRVVRMQPLLLFQGQALQLGRLGVHGLQLVGGRHGGRERGWQVPVWSGKELVTKNFVLVQRMRKKRVGEGPSWVGDPGKVRP